MIRSIGKISKSFFIKVLVGIIILPFVFWGMGDVFSGGNQNIVAKIDSKKISTQEFTNYLNRLNLNDQDRKNLKDTNLLERILSEYIGRKIMSLEFEDYNIELTDFSLKNIILNDKLFFKNEKFSRIKYEKFLLENNLSAPLFEQNIIEQEKKRQFLSFLSEGIIINDFMVKSEFDKENQIKEISYIDLKNLYGDFIPSEEDTNKTFKENEEFFVKKFKKIKFKKIIPEEFSGSKDYDEEFFKLLDNLENDILDGKKLSYIAEKFKLSFNSIDFVDEKRKDKNGNKIENINEQLFSKLFYLKNSGKPEIIKISNNYFIGEISEIETVRRSIDDPDVKNLITAQLKLKNTIEKNNKYRNDILSGKFNYQSMQKLSKDSNLPIKKMTIENLDKNKIFTKSVTKRIFETKDGKINLISENALQNNYIIFTNKTKFKKLDKNSDKYKEYKTRAKLVLANDIYKIYDKNVNNKYKVEYNNKTINRIKNSF